ncbi:hypothetical protein [Streptomyces ipomoeae]|uniref:hypothetical protein n=1 Tax=Streptomyces ipomoeae TaxID=103232 RepID=UPI00114689F0|nr:hypothetical protein [Streptomyces ipomoeae]MDX2936501.1 hypothetical protein [Streptomyces ipomoeae]TQE14941.1 hypothetical protein SipoB123_44640 [Streptomyces ipomoeae]
MVNVNEPDLEEWIEERRRNAIDIADMLGVPPETYTRNPMSVVPALDDYVSRAPLDEFEESDWITLHLDLVSFVADFLIQTYGARWLLVDDPASPAGYRYVIEATGRDGVTRRVDPIDIVSKEFTNRPIEIVRLLASSELTLRLTSEVGED